MTRESRPPTKEEAANQMLPTPTSKVAGPADKPSALADLDAINYAYATGYDIGYAHGYAQRQADQSAHDLQQQIAQRLERIAALPTHEEIERIRREGLWGKRE